METEHTSSVAVGKSRKSEIGSTLTQLTFVSINYHHADKLEKVQGKIILSSDSVMRFEGKNAAGICVVIVIVDIWRSNFIW